MQAGSSGLEMGHVCSNGRQQPKLEEYGAAEDQREALELPLAVAAVRPLDLAEAAA